MHKELQKLAKIGGQRWTSSENLLNTRRNFARGERTKGIEDRADTNTPIYFLKCTEPYSARLENLSDSRNKISLILSTASRQACPST